MFRTKRAVPTSVRLLTVAVLVMAVMMMAVPAGTAFAAPMSQAAGPVAVESACTTLQPDEAASKDAWINQDKPDENKNDNELVLLTESSKLTRPLISFDLTGAVPTNAKVTSAVLSLYVKESKNGNTTVRAHQVTDFWTEDAVSWRYQDNVTTEEWSNRGGDYSSTVLDSESFSDGNKDYWATFNVSAAAQNWAASPATNYGVILEASVNAAKTEVKFLSSNDGTASERPKLRVCWDVGVGVSPDNLAQGTAGQSNFYSHTVTVTDFTNEPVGLSAVSNQGWTVNIYKDVNGNGVKDAGDDPITQTSPLGPNGSTKILVEVVVPANAPDGLKDTTTVTATGLNNGTVDTATNITQIGFPPTVDPVLDGRRDDAYTQNLDAVTQDYCAAPGEDGAGTVLARTMSLLDVANPDYVWVTLEMNLAHVDNTYGNNPHPSWGGGSSLGALVGSDEGQVILRDANGTVIFDVTADYLDNGVATTSGYGSEGIVNANVGNINQVAVESSMGYNMNRFCTGNGSCTVSGVDLESDSPPVNNDYTPVSATFDDWQYTYSYEFRFDTSAFGSAGFGSVSIENVHVSPNKTGGNVIIVEPCDGSIGDRVWFDSDGDKVQDGNESGFNGVMVKLYRDTGDGAFDPNADLLVSTQFTSGDGDYDFTGLGPGDYFVDVEDSTIPTDYVLTTANEPMKVTLAIAQDYNDADFGYRTLPDVAISKDLSSSDPALIGSIIEFTIRITNTGDTVIDVLPLEDIFDPTYLEFVSATPTQSSVGTGVARWNDLTLTQGDLAVNASTSVTVRFRPLKATGTTTRAGIRSGTSVLAPVAEPVVDGLLETDYTFVGRADPNGNAPGNLYKYTGNSMCYYAFVVDRSYNDNVYADDDDAYLLLDGWDGHSYGALDGSDKAIFTVAGSGGTYEDMEMDYVSENNGNYTVDFFDTPINAAASSLVWNLTQSGWDGNGPSPEYVNGDPEAHSPPYNWNDAPGQYWEWHMIYEFSIPKASVGTDCGSVTLAGAHNSPSKDDDSLGLIGDYVWADVDAQGDQDPTEVGIPSVRVNLYQNGTLVRTTQTEPGTSGFYIFSNLEAGTYVVDVDESTLPVGYVLTTNNEPKTVNLSAGQDYRQADFGYVPGQGTIGDFVWYDTDGDKIQDVGEPGINGVTLNLYQGACPVAGGATPFQTQITAGNGGYDFTMLPAGAYCVDVVDATVPANYSLTTANEPMTVNLAQDQDYNDADFGYRVQEPGKTCDVATVFNAQDQYGTDPGDVSDFACVAINAVDFGDLPDTTSGTGAGDYQTLKANNGPSHGISSLTLGATVDGEVDGQPNATATGDGADDDGVTIPTLIVGRTATVVVNSSGTGKVNAFFDWNNDGDFLDSGEAIAELSVVAGNNNLSVPVPIGAVTGADIGARFRLSTGGGLTALGVAPNGEVEDYLVKVQAPGITIEKTTNGASADQPDSTDVPQIVPGATVTWQYLVTNNGSVNVPRGDIQISDNVVGTLMVNGVVQTLGAPYTGATLASGGDIVDNILGPGESFTLQVTRAAEVLNAIDANASATDEYIVGCRDAATNPNGRTTYKNTATVTIVGATATDDSHYCNTPNLGAIGDFVWYDVDKDGIEDITEPGIPNVTLDLYRDTDGTPGLNTATDTKVDSTVTDADGGYLFTKLAPGTYFVDVTDLNGKLTDLTHVVANQSLTDPTPAIVLGTGDVYKDADFGYVDTTPGKAIVGDTVWYDDNGDGVQQPSEQGIPNVTVTVYDRNGTTLGSTDTDENGRYFIEVDPGSGYTASPDPADIPAGYSATTPVPHVLPTLKDGDVYLDADFGYNDDSDNLLGTIGDLVFEDTNNNGVFDSASESGLPGVSVDLIRDMDGDKVWDAGEPVIATVTTDENGAYLFTGVPADDYLVSVSDTNAVLVNYNKSKLGTPGANDNNQVDPYAITLPAGSDNLTADFGYVKIDPTLGQIGNQVWTESDGNGLFDSTIQDVGQPGVTVDLYRNGVYYATTTTGASGDYLFVNLPDGTYTVMVSDTFGVLDGWIVTTLGPNQGDDDNNQLQPYQVVLPSGGENLTADFGYIRPNSIGDFVWYDSDRDGIEDIGEPGIPNVTLAAYQDVNGNNQLDPGIDKLMATEVTDADGGYMFTGLGPGTYFVEVTDDNGKLTGLDHIVANQSNPDPTGPIVLTSGVVYKDADFGYVDPPGKAIVGDTVWIDTNGDQRQQSTEPGIPNVTVTVYDSNNNPIGTADTDSNGRYFIPVDPGSGYYASPDPADIPAGLTATTPVPHLLPILAADDKYLDVDFGYNGSNLGTIGNLVWEDADNSGTVNNGELGISGVSVSLIRDTNGNKTWETGEPIIATTTTDEDGGYLFSGLLADDYLVHVSDTNAALYHFAKSKLGTAGVNNNNQADPYAITLPTGGNNLTADFGYRKIDPKLSRIGNQVWIEYTDGVYNPADGDIDIGQPGVTVDLFKDGVFVARTTTGASGDYMFLNLEPGNYTVQVSDIYNVLDGYVPAPYPTDQTSDNNNKIQPYAITLGLADENLTADFGYTLKGAIGDYVFYDTDRDAIQDVGEKGIANVTLDLYLDNGDNILNTAQDTKIGTATTDSDGGYLFNNLAQGTYFVDVTDTNSRLTGLDHTVGTQSQPDPSNPITLAVGDVYRDADFGYVEPTDPGKAIIGDTVWYDGDGDGVQDPGEPGIPGITVCATQLGGGTTICDVTDESGIYRVEVPEGTYTVSPQNPPSNYTATTPVPHGPVTVSEGDQYLDADFGYNKPDELGEISGTIWEDTPNKDGVLDAGEDPIPGVSVSLIQDTNGNGQRDPGEPTLATDTTDKDGNYLFQGVPAGTYLVLPTDTQNALDDFQPTKLGPSQGSDNNNQVKPYPVSLPANGNDTTGDFGYVRDSSNETGVIGNQVWYEEDGNGIYNPEKGEKGIAGVTVELRLANTVVATTTTGAAGDYVFTTLDAGTYTVQVTDEAKVLEDYILTNLGPNQGSDNNNQQQAYQVVLPTAGSNMTADFGYTRPSAIGDFVWYDADKDGIEDVGEPGIPNVTLDLWQDKNDNNQPDAGEVIATTVTDADGGYLFPNLVADTYFVQVTDTNGKLTDLTQIVANQAQPNPTGAIVLGAGEKYPDADFGYVEPTDPGKAIIGDTVWYDDNGDGVQQPGEPGIPGITVCATPSGGGAAVCDNTDDNGIYRVEVPAGTYTVQPTNPPAGYTATTPVPHGPITVADGDQYLDADFGYDDSGQNLLGSIGNLVFVEKKDNRDGFFSGDDKPLGGVSVSLIRDTDGDKVWDAGEPIIATDTTANTADASTGNYLFTGLPAGTYLVHVSDTNAVLLDYNKTVLGQNLGADNNNQIDPYAVNLTAGVDNLTADFGYYLTERPDVGVIGNQVWVETAEDGLFEENSVNTNDVGQAGVTMQLLKDGTLYATTTTGPSGDYSFVGLPAGNYTVQVEDSEDVLLGYRSTLLGPSQTQDNNNQQQPYGVALATDGENKTADFGYFETTASYLLTKRTTSPSDDPNRPGKAPVARQGEIVVFTIRITNTGTSVLMTLPLVDTYDAEYLQYVDSTPSANSAGVTGTAGTLSWTDLTATEGDLNPTASVDIVVRFIALKDTTDDGNDPDGVTINYANVSGVTADPDGNGPSPALPNPLPPQSDNDDVQIINPTGTVVTDGEASIAADGATLSWRTVSEANVAGFNLLRINPDGSQITLNAELVLAQHQGQAQGGLYSWTDTTAQSATSYVYMVEILHLDGGTDRYVLTTVQAEATSGTTIFLPLVIR